jgi:mono/diheme cytochrome c family protein
MTWLDRLVRVVQIGAAVATAAFVILLFTNDPQEAALVPAASADSGEAIFATRCASCHGTDGGGGFGPALAGVVTDRFPDAADEIVVVTNGQGAMPSFADSLTPEQIAAVVDYTRADLG